MGRRTANDGKAGEEGNLENCVLIFTATAAAPVANLCLIFGWD